MQPCEPTLSQQKAQTFTASCADTTHTGIGSLQSFAGKMAAQNALPHGPFLTWHAGPGSTELQPWQVVRQGLLALPFRFGAGVTHRLLRADSGEDRQKELLKPALGAYWYLDYMAVDSAAQSRGLGSRTLSVCIRKAQVYTQSPCNKSCPTDATAPRGDT